MRSDDGMVYLSNAFNLSMLPPGSDAEVRVTPVTVERAREILSGGFVSAIWRDEVIAVVSDYLGIPVPARRLSVMLRNGDTLVVAQYSGPKLEDGETELPPGAKIMFYTVSVRFCKEDKK